MPTELLMIHLRHAPLFLFARYSLKTPLSFPRSQVLRSGVCKCMICSFLAAPRRQCCWGSPVLRVGFRDGRNPTHARFCGVSLLAAAKLQQLLHLSFAHFGGGLPSLALALLVNKKTRGHAPCETSPWGRVEASGRPRE